MLFTRNWLWRSGFVFSSLRKLSVYRDRPRRPPLKYLRTDGTKTGSFDALDEIARTATGDGDQESSELQGDVSRARVYVCVCVCTCIYIWVCAQFWVEMMMVHVDVM